MAKQTKQIVGSNWFTKHMHLTVSERSALLLETWERSMRDKSCDLQNQSMNTPSPDQSVAPSLRCHILGAEIVGTQMNSSFANAVRKPIFSSKSSTLEVKQSKGHPESMSMESLLEYTANLKLGPGSRNTSLFYDLYCQGRTFCARGQFEQAMKCFREALRLKNITIDAEPFEVQILFADLLFDIGMIQASDPTKRLSAFHHCLHIRQCLLGPEHPAISYTLYHLASAYAAAGMESVALDYLMQALLHSCDSENEHLFDVWIAIGNVQRALGFFEDSSSSFEEAGNLLWRIRKLDATAVARRMGILLVSSGNVCLSPDELNDAVTYFDDLIPKDWNAIQTASRACTTAAAA